MKEPTIYLCVQDDVLQPLRWILKELNKDFHVSSFHSLAGFEAALTSHASDLVIIDSAVSEQSVVSYLQKMKSERPELKIILIVPPVGSKEMVMEIIKAKMVTGLLVKPFTGEVVGSYIAKEFGEGADPDPLKIRR